MLAKRNIGFMNFDIENRIKRIPTKKGLAWLSLFSKRVYNDSNSNITNFRGTYVFEFSNGITITKYFACAWYIDLLAYYLIVYSNDERNYKTKKGLDYDMLWLFTALPNEPSNIKEFDNNEVMLFFEGMGNDQLRFQRYSNFLNDVERLIYIFIESNLAIKQKLILEKIIKERFNCTTKEYLISLMYIFLLFKSNDNDEIDMNSDNCFPNCGISIESIKKIILYYSTSYQEIRTDNLKHLRIRVKPFVRNKEDIIICPNVYNLGFTISHSLYWLIRDDYCKRNDEKFISEFGEIFENYFRDIFIFNSLGDNIKKIEEDSINKVPDFIFNYSQYTIIFECKSTMPTVESMQQIPNISKVYGYYKHLEKAYEQIQNYIINNNISEEHLLKVIVEFTHDKDESSLKSNFKINDDKLLFMNINQIETICNLFKKNKTKFNELLDKWFDIDYLQMNHYSIYDILGKNGLAVDDYYKDKQYYTKYVKEHTNIVVGDN